MAEQRMNPSGEGTVAARRLVTVDQFCADNPAFSKGSMRWLLFQRDSNGLHRAIVKVGRRVLIDVDKFFQWIDDQQDRSLSDVEG